MAVAEQQVAQATSGIGDQEQVRKESKLAADALKGLLAVATRTHKVKPEVMAAMTRDVAQLSSGLDAIAQSQTDGEFLRAVLSLCDGPRTDAASRLGPVLVGIGANIRGLNPSRKPAPDQLGAWADYYEGLGESLTRIPGQCQKVQAAIAAAQQRVHATAEEEAQNRMMAAQLEAQRRQESSEMLLRMGMFLLTPPASRRRVGR